VKLSVRIVKANELALNATAALLEGYSHALMGSSPPQPDHDAPRNPVGRVDGNHDRPIVAATGRRLGIERVEHIDLSRRSR
jgi:hypothetical protein